MGSCKLLDTSNIQRLLDSIDTVLTDCDGVLWHASNVIPGTPEVIQALQQMGKTVYYITNNSTKTRDEYVEKFSKLGFTVAKDKIMTSGYATAQYIKNELKFSGTLYVMGSPGLGQELTAAGIKNVGAGPDPMSEKSDDYIASVPLDPQVTGVVVGFDSDINYLKLSKAIAYLHKGCTFIATNSDQNLPIGDRLLPGAGTILAAVAMGSGRQPDAVCGKPQVAIFNILQKMHHIDASRSVMIGDRLDTDIELASNCGMTSLLVLTGVSSLDDVREKQKSALSSDKSLVPDYYASSLAALGPLLANRRS